MPKWTVNPDYADARSVTADYIQTSEQFVDFIRKGIGGMGTDDTLVLRVRAENVNVVLLDE